MTRRTHGRTWQLAVGVTTLGSILFSSLGVSARAPSSALALGIPSTALPAVAVPAGATKARAIEAMGRRPLSFEENRGQIDRSVKFLSRGDGYTLFLTRTEAVLALRPPRAEPGSHVLLRMTLVGAGSDVRLEGQEPLPGKSHYFVGNDPGD